MDSLDFEAEQMSDAQDGEQQGDDVEHDDIEREQDVDKTLILDLLYKPE